MFAALLWSLLLGAEPCDTGKLLFAQKAYARAQEALWRCVRTATPDTEPAYLLGLTYRELKNYADGLQMVATLPDTVDKLYLRAFLSFEWATRASRAAPSSRPMLARRRIGGFTIYTA
jgi:hypothetical protein